MKMKRRRGILLAVILCLFLLFPAGVSSAKEKQEETETEKVTEERTTGSPESETDSEEASENITEAVEARSEFVTEEEGSSETAEKEEEVSKTDDAGLTPSGNLSLIDDDGSSTGEGKQFITLTTKSGNTFYLIIDRDSKGSETVHFLNLVDERDLLDLMEEEEVSSYREEKETETTTKEPEEINTEGSTKSEEKESDSKSNRKHGGIILFLIGGLAIGAGVYYLVKNRKLTKRSAEDPDLEYDDEEDYASEEEESEDASE